MTGMEALKKFSKTHPEAMTILKGLFEDLGDLIHPPEPSEDTGDIESRLDESYKQIIKDNRRSNVWIALEALVAKSLLEASAKAGIRLK